MRLPTTLLMCDVVTVVCTTFDDGEDHSVKHRSRSSHGSYMTSKLDCKLVRTQSLLKKIGNTNDLCFLYMFLVLTAVAAQY